MHAHAHRALGRPKLVDGKALEAWNEAHPSWTISSLDTETGRERDDFGDPAHSKLGEALLAESTLCRARMQPRDLWLNAMAIDFDTSWAAFKAEHELMDFQDLIERALFDVDQAPGNPSVIYSDESQDASRSELELMQKWGRAAGALVCVGDGDQSIYAWRGADPERFLAMATGEHRRVLEQSYRVPRAVHSHAVEWIEHLGRLGREPVKYLPRDADGAVERKAFRYMLPEDLIADMLPYLEAHIEGSDRPSVMVLGSCWFVVAPIVAALKRKGIPFYNPFRVDDGRLNPLRAARRLLDYLQPDEATYGEERGPWTWKQLWSWIEIVEAKGNLVRGTKKAVEGLAKAEATANIPIGGGCASAIEAAKACFVDGKWTWDDGALEPLRRVLSTKGSKLLEYSMRVAELKGRPALRKEPGLMVGTVHSAKGGEASRVYVLPDISPVAARSWQTAEGEKAIRRLFYVAFTRAYDSLVLCEQSARDAAW